MHGGEIVLTGFDARDGAIARAGSDCAQPERALRRRGAGDRSSGRRSRTAASSSRPSASPPSPRTGPRWMRGSRGRPDSRRGSATPSSSTSTAGRSPSTGTASSTRSRCTRARATPSCTRTRAARPGYSEEWGRAIMGPGELGPGWGAVDYQDLMAVADEAAEALRLLRPRAHGRAGRLVRRLHDVLDRGPHRPIQGRVLRARREQPRLDVRLERHRLGLQGLPRHRRP